MPVRARPSASIAPLVCDGRHATLRRSKTRFDSWQGHSAPSPRVWRTHGGLRSRKAGFDSRVGGWSAVLIRWLSSECDGLAYDPAKVEDQVRFLARTLVRTTLEPDGLATGCNPVQVGSTPTGVLRAPAMLYP